MNIWIPGGPGMLGTHVRRLLTQTKTPFISTNSKEVDITRYGIVEKFLKNEEITHIINCAGYTQVDKAESESELAYAVNVNGPENLGKAALQHGLKAVIHFSTDYVFDGRSRAPYREDHVCAPSGVYGKSKWEGEKRLLAAYPKACIIRTSWLYGQTGKNFVATMLRLMEEREVIRVVNDQVGCPTYCEDLAEATLRLLDQPGIFHFANTNQTSWYEFSKEIYRQAQAMGYAMKVQKIEPIETSEYPSPAKRPAYSALDTGKIAKVLGYCPRPWKEALGDYLMMRTKKD